MNFLVTSFCAALLGGAAFWLLNGFAIIISNVSAMFSLVTIIAAAILVRLNRGIPTVDWKTVDRTALEDLLDGLEKIARSYVITLAMCLLALLAITSALFIPKEGILYLTLIQKSIAALSGFLIGLIIGRTSYMVWLDLDIVRLQRAVILSAADTIDADVQSKTAQEKLERMRGAKITPL